MEERTNVFIDTNAQLVAEFLARSHEAVKEQKEAPREGRLSYDP